MINTSKIIVVGSSFFPRAHDLFNHRFFAQIMMSSYGFHLMKRKSNQKVVGYSHDVHATIVPVVRSSRPIIAITCQAHNWVITSLLQ